LITIRIRQRSPHSPTPMLSCTKLSVGAEAPVDDGAAPLAGVGNHADSRGVRVVMNRTTVTSILMVLLMTGACTSPEKTRERIPATHQSAPAASTFTGTQDVLVSRRSTRGPETCHPENVGRLVVAFLAAVNGGDVEQAVKFFTDDLGWYSVTEGNPNRGGRHFVAYNTTKLRSYLVNRVDQGERMYLVSMDVAYERPGNLAHVAYGIQRTADDLIDYAPEMAGKGAIDCDGGRITVWSMAQRKRAVPGKLCPGKPDPPEIALVCTRK
jgi:hypothetical protein